VTRLRLLPPLGRIAAELVVLAAIAALAAPLAAQDADSTLMRRNAASMFGAPGLVQVPSATATPSGTFDLTFDGARQPFVAGSGGQQRNLFVTVGFLPWLTLVARGTSASDPGSTSRIGDLSASLSVRVLEEHEWTPAIAVGFQDLGGAATHFASRYLVASKTWLGNSTVSLGIGSGKVLNGPFGGVGFGVGQWATLLGEYDGHAVNGGVRVFPFPAFADRIGLQPRVDLVWRQGVGATLGAGFRTMIGGTGEALARKTALAPAHPASAATAAAPAEPRRDARSPAAIATAQQLTAFGFENVRVAVLGGAPASIMDVEYENRRFNRDELDALGIVMGVAAAHAPPNVQRMRVTIRRVNLRVVTVESDIGAFVAFVHDRLSDEEFARQLTFMDPPRAGRAQGDEAPRLNPSPFRLDVFLRPRVEEQVLTELTDFSARVTALVDADMQLAPGLVLNARRGFPVTTTPGFYPEIADPNADRLLLHQAIGIPLGDRWPLTSAITQFSAGRFGHYLVGFANETDVSLAGGRVSLGSTVAILGTTFRTLDSAMVLGNARLRLPVWDVTASLTAGRFRYGDTGASAQLARQFGSTALAFYVRSTSFAKVAGVSVALPLAPAKETAPGLLRLRAPDLYTQSLQSQILAQRNAIVSDVGVLLDTDHEIARVYRTRDLLQAVTVVAHVQTLKDAWRRWLGAPQP
jgi:hypothetical protein